MKLGTSQIEQYEQDGYLSPLQALSPGEARRYFQAASDLQERLGPKVRPTDLSQLHLEFGWAYDLVTHPTVLDGKYAEVIYREYVRSAAPATGLSGITGAELSTDS